MQRVFQITDSKGKRCGGHVFKASDETHLSELIESKLGVVPEGKTKTTVKDKGDMKDKDIQEVDSEDLIVNETEDVTVLFQKAQVVSE